MSEMHLKQLRFTYSACGPFTKNKKEYKNLDSRSIYQNQLEKSVFWTYDLLKFEEQLLMKHYVIKHLIFLKKNKFWLMIYKGFHKKAATQTGIGSDAASENHKLTK